MYDKSAEFIVIGTVTGEITAQAINSALESVRIPAVLNVDTYSRIYHVFTSGIGDTRIMVPRRCIVAALEFLEGDPAFCADPDALYEAGGYGDAADYNDGQEPEIPVVIHPNAAPFTAVRKRTEIAALRETLSCTTCRFSRDADFERDQPWCHAASAPVIRDNYCQTFEAKDIW